MFLALAQSIMRPACTKWCSRHPHLYWIHNSSSNHLEVDFQDRNIRSRTRHHGCPSTMDQDSVRVMYEVFFRWFEYLDSLFQKQNMIQIGITKQEQANERMES